MTRRIVPLAAGCGALLWAVGLAAQQPASETETAPPMVASAAVNPLLDCTSCHMGWGDRAVIAPALSGQPTRYLARQLDAYRTGLREHGQMQATALLLGEGGAAGAARLFGTVAPPELVLTGEPEAVEDGRRIAEEGLWDRGIAPCASCHGLGDWDRGRVAPILHGQRASYLAHELDAYADGTRRSDKMGRMPAIAAELSGSERAAVADYYAAFAPRASRE